MLAEMSDLKIMLSEGEIPTQWYNIMADMPNVPKPPLNPQTKQPVGPEDLMPIFPLELIKQVAVKLTQIVANQIVSNGSTTQGSINPDFRQSTRDPRAQY